jgi:hypothetical protein
MNLPVTCAVMRNHLAREEVTISVEGPVREATCKLKWPMGGSARPNHRT